MPALSQEVIDVLTAKLVVFLRHMGNPNAPAYVASGGSAAVFKVQTADGLRAFKVFDPKFFEGTSGDVERRRLEVQRRLIGHDCPYLIQTFRVEEYAETAFMEMEYLAWPGLKDVLAQVPDSTVSTLLLQLVSAAQYLEKLGIVHRDIKPENIHVSPDFSTLKLLDLGVARDMEAADGVDAAITDHSNKRPFLATAQYSSPEYLFRLDEPSAKLWKGLTFYQIGAVLHDLIMKVQMFHQEVSLDNKWLVAKAVLAKSPSFVDGNPTRLASLKALASRCLVKDLDTRLRLVNWQDFISADDSPRVRLKNRLSHQAAGAGAEVELVERQRLALDRNSHWDQFVEKVRNALIATITNQLPFATVQVANAEHCRKLQFTIAPTLHLSAVVQAQWGAGYHNRKANILLKASLHSDGAQDGLDGVEAAVVCASDIDAGVDEPSISLADKVAVLIEVGLDNKDVGEAVGLKVLYPESEAKHEQ